jgi:DNA primase
MIDTTQIKRNNNLLTIIGGDTQLKRVAGTGGGEWAGPCPFCGGDDRFRVQPEAPGGACWLCRTCTNGQWRDVIEYIKLRDHVDFVQACKTLGHQVRPAESVPQPSRAIEAPKPTGPPSPEWQAKARHVIADCEASLWLPEGGPARAWLQKRGLQDDTLRRWRVGYNPGKPGQRRPLHGLSVSCGIVIPCEVDGTLWYLKVRRSSGKPKYLHVKGGHPALYMAETLAQRDVAVLTEGEFDALLLWQEARDLTGVATLGSATERLDLLAWGPYLQRKRTVLIAYDADKTGRAGAQKLVETLPQAYRTAVPTLGETDKDLTDYHLKGGNLRDLVIFWLTQRQRQLGHRGQRVLRERPEGLNGQVGFAYA